jgi:hypothetical protein
MKIFCAIQDSAKVKLFHDRTKIKLNYLIAYNYLDGNATQLVYKYKKMIETLFLDSGAFSVFQGGNDINVHEYAIYLRKFYKKFDHAFSLDDKLYDPEHNLENHIYIDEAIKEGGKKCPNGDNYLIPVVHDTKDPLEEFKMYVDSGHNYIAISSNIAKNNKKACVKIRETYPKIKVHLFGYLKKELLEELDVESADSSGAQHATKFGYVRYLHDGVAYEFYVGKKEVDKKDKKNKITTLETVKCKDEFKDYIAKYGININSLIEDENNALIVNMLYYHELEKHLNEKLKEKKEEKEKLEQEKQEKDAVTQNTPALLN